MTTTAQSNEYVSLLHAADAFSGQEDLRLRDEAYGLKSGFYTGPSLIKDKARELTDLACKIGGDATFLTRRRVYGFFFTLIIELATDDGDAADERDTDTDAATLAAIFD